MPLPKGERTAGLAGDSDLAAFKDAKNRDAAWMFFQFLNDPENLVTYADAT